MIERIFKKLEQRSGELTASVVSVLKLLVRSRFGLKLPARQRPTCAILGNGPSLNESLRDHTEFLQQTELVAVNGFSLSTVYTSLKPQNYVLLDPAFFHYTPGGSREDVGQMLDAILTQTFWPMNLYVPWRGRNAYLIQQIRARNPQITPVFYNYVIIRGFRWLRHGLFRAGLGMPQCENVLAAALFLMLGREFETIYLFGADHSWHEQLRLADTNELSIRQPHFYDTAQTVVHQPVISPVTKQTARMASQFLSFYRAFYSYEILKQYADRQEVKVINASVKSYIDAFEKTGPLAEANTDLSRTRLSGLG
jgi:hypothetical protein